MSSSDYIKSSLLATEMSQPFRLSVRIRSSAFRGQLLESRSFPLARPCCVPSASPGSSKVSRASISVSTEGFFTINPRSQQRTFKSTARNSKKPKTGYTDAPIDPFDVTGLKAKVEEINEKLRIDLSKLRGGGRFDHTVVEQLRVQAQKGKKETVKLGTLAQVIPKSRLLNVVVGDPEVFFLASNNMLRLSRLHKCLCQRLLYSTLNP